MICISFVRCKGTSSSKKDSVLKNATLTKLGTQKFGTAAQYLESPAKSYVLCYKEKKGTPRNPQNRIEYFVFQVSTNAIVYTNYVEGGQVNWFSDYQLAILTIPGMMPATKTKDDFTVIYNLKDKTRIKKSSLIKKD